MIRDYMPRLPPPAMTKSILTVAFCAPTLIVALPGTAFSESVNLKVTLCLFVATSLVIPCTPASKATVTFALAGLLNVTVCCGASVLSEIVEGVTTSCGCSIPETTTLNDACPAAYSSVALVRAMIVAVPFETGCTTPVLALTVAIVGFCELYVTVAPDGMPLS